jgi:hypothetical protein
LPICPEPIPEYARWRGVAVLPRCRFLLACAIVPDQNLEAGLTRGHHAVRQT